MSRTLTATRRAQIDAAHAADPDAPGPLLAQYILTGNVPVQAVAALLAVSKPTIYRWLYGEAHPRNAEQKLRIQRLLSVLDAAHAAHLLPLTGTPDQRLQAVAQLVRVHRAAQRAATR